MHGKYQNVIEILIILSLYLFNNIMLNNEINFLTLYKLSSNNRRGPVAPIIIRGCPENKAKSIPLAEVAIRVSEIPIKFFVLSPAMKNC